MTTYRVTSDRLSRKRGETFTDAELPGETIVSLVAGGHLQEQKETGPKAANKLGEKANG
jgi:hypothetical protein